MPSLSYIVARTMDGVIGCENRLPWTIPSDLRRFRKITSGYPIVMGRKTFESIGHPLEKRVNIVISRDPNFKSPGTITVTNIETAILFADIVSIIQNVDQFFVIGGGEIFARTWKYVDTVYLTEIRVSGIRGDSFFKESFGSREWKLAAKPLAVQEDDDQYPYRFCIFKRMKQQRRTRTSEELESSAENFLRQGMLQRPELEQLKLAVGS